MPSPRTHTPDPPIAGDQLVEVLVKVTKPEESATAVKDAMHCADTFALNRALTESRVIRVKRFFIYF
jgi:hypothetical protein